MNQNNRNMMVWALILAAVFIVVQLFPSGSSSVKNHPPIAMSEFLSEVNSGRVESVTLKESTIYGKTADGRSFSTYYAPLYDPTLAQRLMDKGIKFEVSPPEEISYFWQVIINWFPLLLLVGLSFFSLRQLQSGGNKAMGFGKSRARLLGEKGLKITFQDVAGIEEAKSELQEVVEFLKDPQKFQRLGGKIPRGVL
ncbi:MAG TPA: ATP-dependent metallopeptidase FtsH/Yme1/Tma family protein, partial [Alphaproteobacteria bacterium]|nr:ATP-dependent metallopeptidase FtsH/Yme1/Tma family protein [Alphaproteobacteria bacterium]